MGKYWSEDCIDEMDQRTNKENNNSECEEAVNRLPVIKLQLQR